MNSKLTTLFLGSILLFISTGSKASLLLGPDLVGYSAVAGAALNISADSNVTDDVGALAAIGIGARTDTANIYSATGAVGTGDGGNAENIYAGAAVSIAANANVKNIYALAAVTLGASGSAENIYAGAAITLGGLSSSLDVYAAAAITGGGATSQTAYTNTSIAIDLYKETFDIDAALEQLTSAQESLFSLEEDFNMDVGYTSHIFEPGVWKGTAVTIAANSTIQFDGMGEENPIWVFNLDAALVIGAATQFEIIRAGEDASVIWNLGGSLSLGAGTSFMGTAFISGAVAGATSEVSCGNLFTSTAIGIGSMISTNCLATDTWTGSINGFAYGIDITGGIISNKSLSEKSEAVLVSEPPTGLIIYSVALIFFAGNLKRQS
ncbi:DUF3494 domain-containing protein [Paraglaciecola psychrophila]|uniref:DUF3494 domain-containing protein n=1 Tax=Paraglaciecola psychrophila TaxID=326544 RepID=UPI000B24422B|nr:DUF3494 domain-containing protein [Paraglaciecola psychrophila]